ncbi:NADH-quinone oxidoreductase subunit NuoH [bacterium]|nr:NADH-quinone oxidoreductase subunit NuoH [bacterium]MBU1072526.1 NADH-quinone oxidoreductase subunit NuoH [bacterium]MBU1674598.1 NADH-quinone oxidoreductase subunit NuoH [bacterium]
MALIMSLVMALCAIVFTWTERKVAGFIQSRYGPMRVGRFHGVLQPVADMVKILGKEDIIPAEADKPLFMLAPLIIFIGSLLAWAAIPFAPGFIAADLDLGLFYIFAVSSGAVAGILMAGWASNNKWALYGAARGAAQMVSYEIPLALSCIPVVMLTGSLNMNDIVINQQGGIWNWYVFHDPFLFLAFMLYFVASIAEVNRGPFDMPETESELVAGYHVEYTGMRFAFFFLAEYANLFLVSCIATAVFLGGWHPVAGPVVLPGLVFVIKAVLLVLLQMWVRWTLPRLRVDQLMHTCWKVMVPLTLLCVLGAGIWMMATGELG